MFTLINKTRTSCAGLFKTAHDAKEWADTFLSKYELEPIELLVAQGTEDHIDPEWITWDTNLGHVTPEWESSMTEPEDDRPLRMRN